jgi:ferredoxin-NADP reductase
MPTSSLQQKERVHRPYWPNRAEAIVLVNGVMLLRRFTQDVAVSDRLGLRGPIGGWFVWRTKQTESAQLIAGGSGIVPLMAVNPFACVGGNTRGTRDFLMLVCNKYADILIQSEKHSTKRTAGWVCSSGLRRSVGVTC